jgi:hypothetical protein
MSAPAQLTDSNRRKRVVNNTARRRGYNTRSSSSNVGAKRFACAVAAAIAFALSAYAEPIRFDNPAGAGHFDWQPQVVGDQIYLNVLVDAAGQTSGSGASGTFKQRARDPFGIDIRRGGSSGEGPQCVSNPTGYNAYVLPLDAGTLIPTPGAGGFPSGGMSYSTDPYPDAPWGGAGGPPTLFTAGEEAYLGVQFFDPAGSGLYNYGWIGVVPEWRTFTIGGVPTDVLVLDAFAWGYETQPDTPILAGIPEPGSLAMLAMGLVGMLGRRALR